MRTKRVTLETLFTDGYTIDEFVDALNDLKRKYKKDYKKLILDEDYDDGDHRLVLVGERELNEQELQKEKDSEEQSKQYRRQQYESLKKEFEPQN